MFAEITEVALKALGGARVIARLTGHESPAIDELAQATRAARAHAKAQQVRDAATGSVQSPDAPSADASSADGTDLAFLGDADAPVGSEILGGLDVTDAGDVPDAGLLADVIDWLKDIL